MRRLLRNGVLITLGILVICIASGCTPDDEDDEYEEITWSLHPDEPYDGPPPATEVEVYPRPGATIRSNTPFNLMFDEGVTQASVNGFPAVGTSTIWTAMLVLEVGTAWLNIGWTNRSGTRGAASIGPYVVVPGGEVLGSPTFTGGTVRNGEVNVDPVPINDSGFLFHFDEPVTGVIRLTDETCTDLNWIGTVQSRIATLTPVGEQKLVKGTTYKIEVDARDAGGDRYRATVTFTTKPR